MRLRQFRDIDSARGRSGKLRNFPPPLTWANRRHMRNRVRVGMYMSQGAHLSTEGDTLMHHFSHIFCDTSSRYILLLVRTQSVLIGTIALGHRLKYESDRQLDRLEPVA